jgi:hypothetical protein
MELEHWSLLVLDYASRSYYTLDPLYGTRPYPFLNRDVLPVLQDILSTEQEWIYDDSFDNLKDLNGPMYRSSDHFCYLWTTLISYMILNTNNAVEVFDDLNALSLAQLQDLIEGFFGYAYTLLGNLIPIYKRINLNE